MLPSRAPSPAAGAPQPRRPPRGACPRGSSGLPHLPWRGHAEDSPEFRGRCPSNRLFLVGLEPLAVLKRGRAPGRALRHSALLRQPGGPDRLLVGLPAADGAPVSRQPGDPGGLRKDVQPVRPGSIGACEGRGQHRQTVNGMMQRWVPGGVGERSAAPDQEARLPCARPPCGHHGTAAAQSFFSGARSPWQT